MHAHTPKWGQRVLHIFTTWKILFLWLSSHHQVQIIRPTAVNVGRTGKSPFVWTVMSAACRGYSKGFGPLPCFHQMCKCDILQSQDILFRTIVRHLMMHAMVFISQFKLFYLWQEASYVTPFSLDSGWYILQFHNLKADMFRLYLSKWNDEL